MDISIKVAYKLSDIGEKFDMVRTMYNVESDDDIRFIIGKMLYAVEQQFEEVNTADAYTVLKDKPILKGLTYRCNLANISPTEKRNLVVTVSRLS
jgi:hypothetical protein